MAGRGWPIFAAAVLTTGGNYNTEHSKAARINRQANLARSAVGEDERHLAAAVETHLARAAAEGGGDAQEHVPPTCEEAHLAPAKLDEDEQGHASMAEEAHLTPAAFVEDALRDECINPGDECGSNKKNQSAAAKRSACLKRARRPARAMPPCISAAASRSKGLAMKRQDARGTTASTSASSKEHQNARPALRVETSARSAGVSRAVA